MLLMKNLGSGYKKVDLSFAFIELIFEPVPLAVTEDIPIGAGYGSMVAIVEEEDFDLLPNWTKRIAGVDAFLLASRTIDWFV